MHDARVDFTVEHLCPNSIYSICCGFVVQLVVQQIHNKSNKWSLGIIPPQSYINYDLQNIVLPIILIELHKVI